LKKSPDSKPKAARKKQLFIFAGSGMVVIIVIMIAIFASQRSDTPSTTPSPDIAGKTSPANRQTVPTSKIEIRDISVTDITDKSMTIQWKTNVPANGQIIALEQNSSNSVGGWPDDKPVLEHKVILEKLTPGTAYILKIKSKDAAGNEATFEGTTPFQTRASRTTTDIKTGEKAPDFSLQSLSGETISLSAQGDKKTMLVFWMLSCSSCREELPYLQDFWENARPGDLSLLAINIGENENLIKNYAISQKLTFPVLLDQDTSISKKYSIVRYPTIFLLAPDKTVIAVREEQFKNTNEIKEFFSSKNQP
jgi:peroxiredoxin